MLKLLKNLYFVICLYLVSCILIIPSTAIAGNDEVLVPMELVIEDNLSFTGTTISFDEEAIKDVLSQVEVIDIEKDTEVYLPKDVQVVEYEPKEYTDRDFGTQIGEHIFKGFPYYGLLFLLAAVASL